MIFMKKIYGILIGLLLVLSAADASAQVDHS